MPQSKNAKNAGHCPKNTAPDPATDRPKRAFSARPAGFPTHLSLAATSFTIPGTVAQNCRHLAGQFEEVALLLFETEACLAYTADDLPPDLSGLPLNYHAHLPLDLPWERGFAPARAALEELVGMISYLSPRRFVLHPPPDPGLLPELARAFSGMGVAPQSVLVENIEGHDLSGCWAELCEAGFGICLDLGHVLAYGQQRVLTLPGLWDKVDMLHVYAPDGSRHTSLANLSEDGYNLLESWIKKIHPGGCVTLEVFNEPGLMESARALGRMFEGEQKA